MIIEYCQVIAIKTIKTGDTRMVVIHRHNRGQTVVDDATTALDMLYLLGQSGWELCGQSVIVSNFRDGAVETEYYTLKRIVQP